MPIMSPDSKDTKLGSHDTTFAGFTFTEQSTLADAANTGDAGDAVGPADATEMEIPHGHSAHDTRR